MVTKILECKECGVDVVVPDRQRSAVCVECGMKALREQDWKPSFRPIDGLPTVTTTHDLDAAFKRMMGVKNDCV
jgi:hypothetical protein